MTWPACGSRRVTDQQLLGKRALVCELSLGDPYSSERVPAPCLTYAAPCGSRLLIVRDKEDAGAKKLIKTFASRGYLGELPP